MTVESARLDAESLKELVRLAEHRVCVHPEDGWAQDFTDNVPALIDALESARDIAVRLEQENAEALRLLEIALELRMSGEWHGRTWGEFDSPCEKFVRAARL